MQEIYVQLISNIPCLMISKVFSIAVLERIREDVDKLQAVVLAPTREIAIQAHATIENLSEGFARDCVIECKYYLSLFYYS